MDVTKWLNELIVNALPSPECADRVTYDTAVKGFGLRVTIAGAKSFVLTYRRKSDGKQRRLTIGTFPTWTTTQAREEAKRLKREIDGGGDPVGEQQATRAAPPSPTLPPASSRTTFHANGPRHSGSIASRSPPTSCPPSA